MAHPSGEIGGSARKGRGDADALTLAAGELTGWRSEILMDRGHQGEELPDSNGSAAAVPFFKRRNKGNVFRDREVREEAGILNNVSDATAEADGVPIAGRRCLGEDFPLRGQHIPLIN